MTQPLSGALISVFNVNMGAGTMTAFGAYLRENAHRTDCHQSLDQRLDIWPRILLGPVRILCLQ